MTWERALAEIPAARSRGELGEVLVGHGDGQPVGAGFGEEVFQRVGQGEEVLAFVDVQARVGALMRGDASAAGGGLPGRGDDERPGELGGFLAEGAFGEAGQAQAAVVENLGEGEGGGPGGDGLAGEGAEQERPQLVHQRADRVRAARFGQLLVPGPEPGQHRVPHLRGQAPAVGVGSEEAGDIGECDLSGAGGDGLQEGEACGAENVVGAGSPELAEDAAEDAGDVAEPGRSCQPGALDVAVATLA
jgi:hypothetical protein